MKGDSEKVVHQLTDWSAIRCRPASRGFGSRSPRRVGLSLASRHFKRRSPLPPKKEVEKARLADACLTRTTSAIDCFLPRLFLVDNNRYCQTSYFSFMDWIMKKNSLCCKKKIFLKIYKFEYVYLCVISVQQSRKLSRSNEMYALLKLLRWQDGSTWWRWIIEESKKLKGSGQFWEG